MNDLTTDIGLNLSVIEKIRGVFSGYPQIDRVLLFGSRAKGNYRPGSDIDLTMVGNQLTLSKLIQIENDLDALSLPYKIDLSLCHKIGNPDLVAHIQRVGVVFYE